MTWYICRGSSHSQASATHYTLGVYTVMGTRNFNRNIGFRACTACRRPVVQ